MLIQNRSLLYNLSPLNLGSGFVESLSSYLLRLANAHNVDLGTLTNKIIIPKLGKDYLIRSTEYGGNSFFEGAKTMNSVNQNAFSMAALLDELTGRDDLKQLTLLDLQGKISNRNLLKKELSWCPQCLKEWQQENNLYYPLIWQFQLVKVCFKHNQILMNRCGACSKVNPILRRNMSIGYCSYCGHPFFEDSKISPDKLNIEEDEWYNFCFQNIEFILVDNLKNLDTVNFVNEIFTNCFSKNLNSFSKTISIPKSTLRGWLKGENVPTLEGILKICFILKIDCFNFYPDIDLGKVSLKPFSPPKTGLIRKPIDLMCIELELYQILEKQVPISMTGAADLIGRNKRLLYYHFPDLCKKISKRYLDYRQVIARERIKNIQQEVELAFWMLKSDNIFPSRVAIEKKINKPGILREPKIKAFWQELMDIEVIDNDE